MIKKEIRFNSKSQYRRRRKKLRRIGIFKKITTSSFKVRMRKMLSKQVDIISFRALIQEMDSER
jgi:hypothetical protein